MIKYKIKNRSASLDLYF